MGKEVQRWLPRILIIAAVAGVWHVYRSFNPPSGNHIILVNSSGAQLQSPLTIMFCGGDAKPWKITLVPPQHLGASRYSCLVVDVERAFFYGRIVVIDGRGSEICNYEFGPPGRINHTAIVFCPKNRETGDSVLFDGFWGGLPADSYTDPACVKDARKKRWYELTE